MKIVDTQVLALLILLVFTGCSPNESNSAEKEEETDTEVTPVDTSAVIIDTPNAMDSIDMLFVETDEPEEGEAPQELKIGHINSAEILLLMPEIRTADQELENYAIALEKHFQDQVEAYQELYAEIATDTSMPESIKQVKISELNSMEANIAQLQQSSQQDLARMKDELYAPIIDQINRVIQRVARENDYTYIIDGNSGALVYGVDAYDITPLVKRRLGI